MTEQERLPTVATIGATKRFFDPDGASDCDPHSESGIRYGTVALEHGSEHGNEQNSPEVGGVREATKQGWDSGGEDSGRIF